MSCRKDVVIIGLQLWLPLNGDVKNYGLDGNATIYSAYVKYTSEGIIGSKSLGLGELEITPSNFSKYNDFTLSFWSYPNEDLITSDWTDIITIRDGGSNLRFQYCNNQWHSLGVYNNPDFKIMKSNFDVGYNMIGKYNRWVHSCITSNNNVLYWYIDGNLISSVSLQSDWNSHLKLIHTSNIGKIYLSDLRLYDSTLSPKQIKLLSQAMICHYPMGNVDGKIGGRNLLPKTNQGITNWSNIHDGGTYSLEKVNWQGVDAVKMNCATATSSWKMFTFNGLMQNFNRLKAGEEYILSYDSDKKIIFYSLCDLDSTHDIVKSSSTLYKKTSYGFKTIINLILKDNLAKSNQVVYLMNNLKDGESVIIANLKLEKSSTSTPYTPAPEDNPPFYDNIIPDISGYQNNGEVTDSACPTWSNDSPRYLGSYEFNGKNQYISGLSPISNNTKEFTIAFWVKLKNVPDTMTFYTARAGIGSGVALFFVNKNIRFDDNVQSTFNYTYDLSSNKWTHLCVTRNNTSKKLYVNGKLVDSTSNVGNMQNIGKYFTIGGSESSNNGIADMNWLNGKLSDLRIYSTNLSDEDVLDLYQSSASLDSQGNLILSGEVIE